MPYFHTIDKGNVGLWSRTCKVCRNHWTWKVWFLRYLPEDMYWVPKPRKATTYAKWADNYPGAATLAQALPPWPRWARILAGLIPFALFVALIWFLIWIGLIKYFLIVMGVIIALPILNWVRGKIFIKKT